ncbi:putative calnexin -like protein [Capsicum annuum]|nr:putative calnexin -like protein [Capsicum annuum]
MTSLHAMDLSLRIRLCGAVNSENQMSISSEALVTPAAPAKVEARTIFKVSVLKYAKYIKVIMPNKNRLMEYVIVALTEVCITQIQKRFPTKLKDPGRFTIQITIGQSISARGVCDLGESINIMPISLFRKMRLGSPRPTAVVLHFADHSLSRPDGIVENILVHAGSLIFPMDFIILDFDANLLDVASIITRKTVFEPLNRPIGPSSKALSKLPTSTKSESVIKEVVRKEVIKWLDARIVYPISDSKWVSPVQFVQKKRGMTILTNENNELILTSTVTGRICIDYRKLNDVTRKDHYPIPFIDQMLDRLAVQEYYFFLDGYSCYNQISITPEDQEKTTFSYPYGTYAFRRMPFGLSNTLATFHICMMEIFYDIVEDFVKVSQRGLEVDTAKLEVIEKLPYLVSLKAPILIAPDWALSFKLMCNTSVVVVGAYWGSGNIRDCRNEKVQGMGMNNKTKCVKPELTGDPCEIVKPNLMGDFSYPMLAT